MKSRTASFLNSFFLLLVLLNSALPQARQTSGQSSKPLFSNIKFETAQNLIFVRTNLNDSEPFWFILDSGASISVINEKLARSLGFKLSKKNKINAIGGKIDYSLVRDIDLNVSGATLADQTIAAIDLSVLEPKLGRKIDGIIGAEFFNRYVIEIDYAAQTLNLYDPQNFQYSGAGEVIEFEIENNTPFIRVRVSPNEADFVEGKFLVDTGAIAALYINKKFADTNGLPGALEKTVPEPFTTHLGGEVTGRVGRMRKMKVGNFLLENPVAHFLEKTGGAGGSLTTTHDGIIGGDLFRKFTIIFDYSRRQLILQPNENLLDPFEFDQSGLELVGAGADFKTIKVRKIMENSPAGEAGLRVADIIVSIDGKAANELSLDGIEEMFSQPGREYDLIILRGQEQLKAKIKLKPLI